MKRLLLSLALVGAASSGVEAQDELLRSVRSGPLPVERTGEDVYRAACVTCHGPDGTGSLKSVVAFAVPMPDFSDCAFSTAEPDPDWHAVVHEGGPIRGLDRRMPAFGEALSREDIALAVGHLRTFCRDATWPRGDLNLPRAFFTEKAFPENEFVWATTFTERGERSVTSDLIYERRLGPRSQVELVVPVSFRRGAAEAGSHGLGDIALAFKRTLSASLSAGHIASVGLEVSLPTGKEQLGLGDGYTVFEPFATWGQILPRNSFLQPSLPWFGCVRSCWRLCTPTRNRRLALRRRHDGLPMPTRQCSLTRTSASRVITTSSRKAVRMSRSVRTGEAP